MEKRTFLGRFSTRALRAHVLQYFSASSSSVRGGLFNLHFEFSVQFTCSFGNFFFVSEKLNFELSACCATFTILKVVFTSNGSNRDCEDLGHILRVHRLLEAISKLVA